MKAALEIVPGLLHYPLYLDRAGQEALREDVRAVLALAPLFQPRMPRTGKALSVAMSNCGPLGWVSDERGYRYQPTHPATGAPWPATPARLLQAWAELAPGAPPPEACLINRHIPGDPAVSTDQCLHSKRRHQPCRRLRFEACRVGPLCRPPSPSSV